MELLSQEFLLERFFETLSTADARALLLDYDGTLAPFHVDRSKSIPYPAIEALIQKMLTAQHTRIVVISGRSATDLLPLLRFDPQPEIWASHGRERLLVNGDYRATPLDSAATADLERAYAAIAAADLSDYCERKPASLALHWRGLDVATQASIETTVRQQWQRLDQERHYRVLPFDGGIELCVRGQDKGAAVRTILAELPARPAAAYLGDDHTDEDAFRAIKKKGLGVLVRAEYRPTAADLWLTPPAELLTFLRRWHEAAMR